MKAIKNKFLGGVFSTLVLLSLVILQSCGEDEIVDNLLHEDYIKIISVTPSDNLEDGVEYDFVVEIDYELASTPQGELYIGFNSYKVNSFRMVSEATHIVEKGAGTHTFNVTELATDWLETGDFKVYVNMSESPHPIRWTPLVSDIHILEFSK